MTVTWVLERDVFAEECFEAMVEHFKTNSIPYHIVRIVPLIHEIEGKVPQIEGPAVVYGTIGSQKLAQKHNWTPGVWTNNTFNESVLIEKLGDRALNHDLRAIKFKDVLKIISWNVFFIKPNTDTKEFAGMVIERDQFEDWYMKLTTAGYFDDSILETEVVVSQPKNIGTEWRLVMVEGKVVEASIYRQYQKIMPERNFNKDVIAFAEACAIDYCPAPVFVMDICESSNGLKVIEANAFNSAGLYKCDVGNIINEVNKFVEKTHG